MVLFLYNTARRRPGNYVLVGAFQVLAHVVLAPKTFSALLAWPWLLLLVRCGNVLVKMALPAETQRALRARPRTLLLVHEAHVVVESGFPRKPRVALVAHKVAAVLVVHDADVILQRHLVHQLLIAQVALDRVVAVAFAVATVHDPAVTDAVSCALNSSAAAAAADRTTRISASNGSGRRQPVQYGRAAVAGVVSRRSHVAT
jgi:hypothetical protein